MVCGNSIFLDRGVGGEREGNPVSEKPDYIARPLFLHRMSRYYLEGSRNTKGLLNKPAVASENQGMTLYSGGAARKKSALISSFKHDASGSFHEWPL